MDKHVVLHATLKNLGGISALLPDPARVPLFVQICKGDLVYVKQDVVDRLVRVVYSACLVVKVQRAYRSPVNALLLVKLELKVAITQNVILVIDNFDLSLFKVISRFSSHFAFLKFKFNFIDK